MDFYNPFPENMTDTKIDVISTSAATAQASPIIINQTERLRFSFIPTLVDNHKDQKKAVSGKLIFEKKKQAEKKFPSEQQDADKISRQSIRAGDWTELNFDTNETYALFVGLQKLYELHKDIKTVPVGYATYIRTDSYFKNFLSILQTDPSAARMIGEKENYELVKILLQLITQSDSYESLKEGLSSLKDVDLNNLNTSINLENLIRLSKEIKINLNNNSEEFWQSTIFNNNQWIISQIFSCPCTIFSEKAYVGGKNIHNKQGNICDFIYQNKLSKNVALIEIKTPCTDLMGAPYRGTYCLSQELSGAISQILNYRDSILKEYANLKSVGGAPFEVFSPKCVLVIGKIGSLNEKQVAAFENFRNALHDVIIITYDELLQRIVDIINIISIDMKNNIVSHDETSRQNENF